MALAERITVRDEVAGHDADVVLGEDWVNPETDVSKELRARRARRGWFALNQSPLTRKIIIFNLMALLVLVLGILYLNSSRDTLALQRSAGLVSEAELVADVLEAQLPRSAPVNLGTGDGVDIAATLAGIDLRAGSIVEVFDATGAHVAGVVGARDLTRIRGLNPEDAARTPIIDALGRAFDTFSVVIPDWGDDPAPAVDQMIGHLGPTLQGATEIHDGIELEEGSVLWVTTPIMQGDTVVGVVAVTGSVGEIDSLVDGERERVYQMFVVAALVSIGLSLVLASTIANPISDLAAAAELGRDRGRRGNNVTAARIRIPDLTARPDEIGRLSGALRGMVSALYERIDANEQFAADVAHEIKNPLASLRSAVGSLRFVKKEEHREKLLDVIDHDVRRLDRLVSDISNASRLDSELVKEEEESFDLLKMLGNLAEFLGQDAQSKGIDFITDMPSDQIIINGLEARLAQVFVNLITNAISFCEDGDAIRVWTRKRENRVLVVVEDTGPGIPEEALTKIFNRFYTNRPTDDFGNNSGLGLAISKQIVEAHGGVIWAENIRPTEADASSEPLGARFVVGLPV
ncbi:sensor histidine kinase [Mesobacterium pallidum]|uniref:sensor histidine kinase n=1 Tax=Mesobacterium pallidum TaxID=2872037 RepID=UPI001EE312D4|nr:sensor histidine kinase [Mesobacterium pallidum]